MEEVVAMEVEEKGHHIEEEGEVVVVENSLQN